jgi:phosphoglycolate phosphatase-like HAD superfamily hydrolase
MIRECLRAMRLGATQALYVGDMVLDVQSATRAGLPVVLVEGGSSAAAELAATGQTVVHHLRALVDLLP